MAGLAALVSVAMAVLEYLWKVPLRVLFVVVLMILVCVCVRAVYKLFKVSVSDCVLARACVCAYVTERGRGTG